MTSIEQQGIPETITRGEEIAKGKTKRLFAVIGHPELTIAEYKNDITALDDKTLTDTFDTKARDSNTTNACVFEMLNAAQIPTAFKRQLREHESEGRYEFLAEKCTMVPLEVVARRYAVGSYLKRHPELQKPTGEMPHRFEEEKGRPLVEFFLKTTEGGLKVAGVEGLNAKAGEEDPFIPNPRDAEWKLAHPKKQSTEEGSDLKRTVEAVKIVPSLEAIQQMEEMTAEAFMIIEKFFTDRGFMFVDFKIEFGLTSDGRLVIADVIDNDSWRLRGPDGKELSKEVFRDMVRGSTGKDMEQVADNYTFVAHLLEESRIKA